MADLETYWQGTRVRIYNTVTQSDGTTLVTNATISAVVTMGLNTPDEVQAPVAVTNAGGGDYYIDVTLTVPGICVHSWATTAPVIVTDEDRLYVRRRVA